MTDFYTGMASTAAALIAQYGKSLALRRVTGGTYDPVTGTESGATSQDLPITGLYTKMSADYIATHEVQEGDRLAIIDGSTEPQLADKLVDGADILQVVSITAMNPAGTPLAYKLQVRA